MAEDDPAKTEIPRAAPRRARRPPATIDVAATEVAVEAPAQTATASPAAEGKSAAADLAFAPVQESPRVEVAASDDRPSADPRASTPRQAWLLAGAAAIGAAAAIIVIGGLLGAGLLPFNNSNSSQIATRLAGLEARLSASADRPAADARALTGFETRIGKIESELSARGGADPGLTMRLGAMDVAIKSIGDAAASLNGQTLELAGAVRSTRDRLEAIVKSLAEQQRSAQSESEKLSSRLAALESSTRQVEKKIETPGSTASDRGIRAAILTSTLKDAVERGAPFATELSAVAPLRVDPKLLAALEPFAGSGVPTAATLAAELTALVPVLRRAAELPAANAGFFDRLQTNANRLVRIRPADEPAGAGPADAVERIERAAARRDIAGARAGLAQLPAPIASLAAAWVARVQAREVAFAAVQEISADALKTLAAPGRQP